VITDHTPRGACWMSGTMRTDDGIDITLERGALWLPDGADGPAALPAVTAQDMATDAPIAFDGPRIPRGQRVRILSVDPEDAYYPERNDVVGLRCSTTEVLRRNTPGTFTGEVRCDDRKTRYFLKVAVQLLPY